MKGEMTQTVCTRSPTRTPPRLPPPRAPPLNSRSSPPLRETCSAQVTAQGPPARFVCTHKKNTQLMSSACLHAEPTLCTVQPHICSLIYIRRTSFTSVLNLSRVINFKGEISLFTSVSESALSQGKSFNFQTNKRPLMHIFRCQLSIQCVSCLILPFVLSSVFGRPCGALFVP